MYISSFCSVQYEMVASCLLILPMQREVSPLLCHKRTLRVRAEFHKKAAAQTQAQSSCLSPVPHVIPHISWANRNGQTWGENRVLGECCLCSRYPRWISPTKKAGGNALAKGRHAKMPDQEGSAAGAISSQAWHQPGVSSGTLPQSSFTAGTSLLLLGTEKAEIVLEG